MTTPALTAVDLCTTEVGADVFDVVLRERAASLSDLTQALELTPGRRGNAGRRQLLLDSRAEPWSAAERAAHQLLHNARVTGWVANHPIRLMANGQVTLYYVDICFRGPRLAVEIDGRRYHSSSSAFESDRFRQNDLQLAGWRVLRFTWAMIVHQPDYVIDSIRRAIR